MSGPNRRYGGGNNMIIKHAVISKRTGDTANEKQVPFESNGPNREKSLRTKSGMDGTSAGGKKKIVVIIIASLAITVCAAAAFSLFKKIKKK